MDTFRQRVLVHLRELTEISLKARNSADQTRFWYIL